MTEKNMVYKVNDPKISDSALYETLFHNANGYIGIRSCCEEGCPEGITSIRGSYINGFYDFSEMSQAEKLYGLVEEKQIVLNIADTQGICLFLDNEKFSVSNGRVLESHRSLNMAEGYTERYIHWLSPAGKEIEIRIRRIVSFARPSLFLIAYSVKALNFSGSVRFVSSHCGEVENYSDPADPRIAPEAQRRLAVINRKLKKNASFITSETIKSKLRVCTAVEHKLLDGSFFSTKIVPNTNTQTVFDGNTAICTINASIKKNEQITLCKYSVFTDSIRCRDCTEKAKEILEEVLYVVPEILYKEQKEYLDVYWDNTFLAIEGDNDLEQAVQYNLYQLLQSTGRDSYSSVASKGLSGEGYEGHFFWDSEMYIEPFFVLTNPDIARNLIMYRYTTLDEARKNACLMGHKKGALFPWRTIMGRECSGFFPAGTAQYHINGAIAWSVVFYFLATGDLSFIEEAGAELVFECARLWIDTGNYHCGQFRINDVTGPDEYTCIVNNNYYTNVCAQYNLVWAVKLYELLKKEGKLERLCRKINLKEDEINAFAEAAKKMYLPYDEQIGINPQDDSFLSKKRLEIAKIPKDHFPLLLYHHPLFLYRHQVCKQADTVLAHFIFEDAQPLEVIINSFLYYEDITTHDSSLSKCIFSIVASRIGFYEEAYEYFGDSARLDLLDTAGNTKDGLHIANMGGTYMAILFGFAGLRIKESCLSLSPHLPKSWKIYRFNLTYMGSRIRIEIDTGGIYFTLLSGTDVPVEVYNTAYTLHNFLTISLKKFRKEGIRKYKAIIFDLDGVLVCTDRYHYLAWERIARELGIPFDDKLNNALRGVSRMESLEIILKNGNLVLDEKEKIALAEKKNNLYRNYLEVLDSASVITNVPGILKHLKTMGIKLAVGSSSKNARLILQKTGLSPYFDVVVDGTDIAQTKPHPEVFLKAAELLGTSAEETLVVEDAVAGIEAACEACFDSAALGAACHSPLATYCLDRLSGVYYYL